jgi:hypothetical protein
MFAVRIEPVENETYLIDVTCDCGQNGLTNQVTNTSSFRHEIKLGDNAVTLSCRCGKKFHITPQQSHFHVTCQGVE